jgi:hypothetical protein
MKVILLLVCTLLAVSVVTIALAQDKPVVERLPDDVVGSHGRFIKSFFVETEGDKYHRVLSVEPRRKFILTDVIGHNAAFIKLATDYKEKRVKSVFTLTDDRLHLQSGISFEPGDTVYVQTTTDALITFCGYFVVL